MKKSATVGMAALLIAAWAFMFFPRPASAYIPGTYHLVYDYSGSLRAHPWWTGMGAMTFEWRLRAYEPDRPDPAGAMIWLTGRVYWDPGMLNHYYIIVGVKMLIRQQWWIIVWYDPAYNWQPYYDTCMNRYVGGGFFNVDLTLTENSAENRWYVAEVYIDLINITEDNYRSKMLDLYL